MTQAFPPLYSDYVKDGVNEGAYAGGCLGALGAIAFMATMATPVGLIGWIGAAMVPLFTGIAAGGVLGGALGGASRALTYNHRFKDHINAAGIAADLEHQVEIGNLAYKQRDHSIVHTPEKVEVLLEKPENSHYVQRRRFTDTIRPREHSAVDALLRERAQLLERERQLNI